MKIAVCLECKKTFQVANRSKKVCSEECKRIRNNRIEREKYVPKNQPGTEIPLECIWCHKTFSSFSPLTKTCSDECKRLLHKQNVLNWRAKNPERSKEIVSQAGMGQTAKNSLLPDALFEFVDRQQVFKDAGYVCQICDEPIDMTLKAPHRFSPSIDHIIPLAKGGTHTRENVQATHLFCNMKKKDRIMLKSDGRNS